MPAINCLQILNGMKISALSIRFLNNISRSIVISALLALNCSCVHTEQNHIKVYITNTGRYYHTGECTYLSKSKIPIRLTQAVAGGYSACHKCSTALPIPNKTKPSN